MKYNIFAIIRKSPIASGTGHIMGVFDDKQAALDDVMARNRKDTATSGTYVVGAFFPMW